MNLTIYEYLRERSEKLPAWLDSFREGDDFPREDFFRSRIVYYPGSGTDGHAVKAFGSTHSAHCFIYADYMIAQTELEAQLDHEHNGFRGYKTLLRKQLAVEDLVPLGWTCHLTASEASRNRYLFSTIALPFGFLEILQRTPEYDENFGPRRLAILFLGADGVATYDALFCQQVQQPALFGVLLQDHGFGGNYNHFGQGGLMERIASRCDAMPEWLLVARNTKAWNGFEQIHGLIAEPGGMHGHPRYLYKKSTHEGDQC